MHFSKQFLTGLALAFVLTACGPGEDPPAAAPEAAAAEVDQTFATADPELKQAADAAADALRAREYEKAYVSLFAISANKTATPEQLTTAARSMESLQKQLATALVSGDTNAMRVIQMMQATRGR